MGMLHNQPSKSLQHVKRLPTRIEPQGPEPPPTQGRGGNVFPNIEVCSHTGARFRLYDDLIKDKVVMINFMSIKRHKSFPVTQYLAAIAERLGARLGQEMFMYSITTDPDYDSPARLSAFAKEFGTRHGWHFLTSSERNIEAVGQRLRSHANHGPGGACSCESLGKASRLVHYGNGGVGIWGAFGADSDPDLAVERFSWVQNGTRRPQGMHRAGPPRLS